MNLRWLSSLLLLTSLNLQAADAPDYSSFILTPPAPATPHINGPTIFGVRPDAPFLYTIPATGDRPMTFSVENLPDGLSLDSDRRAKSPDRFKRKVNTPSCFTRKMRKVKTGKNSASSSATKLR